MGAAVSKHDEVAIFDELEKWNSNRGVRFWQKPTIIVSGLVGVGKSALVNALACKEREGRCGDNDNENPFTKRKSDDNLKRVIVTDTPGLNADNRSFQRDIQEQCRLLQGESNILVYAINMTDTRFERNHPDLPVMKALHEADQNIWNRAVIVLAQANMEENFKKKLGLWTPRIRHFLVEVVGLENEKAKSIQILPAGYDGKERLDQQPPGLLWVNSIWLAFMRLLIGTPCFQSFAEFLADKIFVDPGICGESICEFLSLHQVAYVEKASVFTAETREKVAQACSFLHVQRCMLENSKALQHDNFACRGDDATCQHVVEFWKKTCKTVSILVTGSSESGKTTLINSILFGFEKQWEKRTNIPHTFEVSSTFDVTCFVRETAGLDAKETGDFKSDLILFCVRAFDDRVLTRSNMVKFTNSHGLDVWKKVLVVLTEANLLGEANDYRHKFDREIEFVNETVRSIVGNDLTRPIPVIPAGYHKHIHIQGDVEERVWVVDIWMKMILMLPPACKVAFITLVNDLMFPNYLKCMNKSLVSSFYKFHLIETLYSVLLECKLLNY